MAKGVANQATESANRSTQVVTDAEEAMRRIEKQLKPDFQYHRRYR